MVYRRVVKLSIRATQVGHHPIICWVIITVGPRLANYAYQELKAGPQVNRITQVYQYSIKHPGEVYFPWYPLPCLMGEGQLYHFSYGVFDRELAGRPLREEHFLKYVPPHSKYICFMPPSGGKEFPEKYVLSYLRNYHKVPAPAELEDWEVYQRD